MRLLDRVQPANDVSNRIDESTLNEVEEERKVFGPFRSGTGEYPAPSPHRVGQARDHQYELSFRDEEPAPLCRRDVADRIEDHVEPILEVGDGSLDIVNDLAGSEAGHEIVIPGRRYGGYCCTE